MYESPALHPTLVNWHTDTRLQVLTTSESLCWNRGNLFIERQEASPETVKVPYLEDDVFGLLLQGSARVHMHLVDGPSFDTFAGPQSLQIIPRHSEFAACWDSAWTYAVLRLKRQFGTEMA